MKELVPHVVHYCLSLGSVEEAKSASSRIGYSNEKNQLDDADDDGHNAEFHIFYHSIPVQQPRACNLTHSTLKVLK